MTATKKKLIEVALPLEAINAASAPEAFILVLTLVDGDCAEGPWYVQRTFQKEPDFGAVSVSYVISDLLGRHQVT